MVASRRDHCLRLFEECENALVPTLQDAIEHSKKSESIWYDILAFNFTFPTKFTPLLSKRQLLEQSIQHRQLFMTQ